MSDLSSQLSAFRDKIRSGSSVPLNKSIASKVKYEKDKDGLNENTFNENKSLSQSLPIKRNLSSNDSIDRKKQRVSAGAASGSHLATQLHLAVEYIKHHEHPVTVKELQEHLAFDISKTLLPCLKEIGRIKYDAENKTLEYVSMHNIRSSNDLMKFLQSQPTFKGVNVKDLRDGWFGCLEAINKLEEEEKIIVLRTKKENSPRYIWPNMGGSIGFVDEEFCRMWSTVKLPQVENLYHALVDQGLKPAGADPQVIRKKPLQKEKKLKKPRKGKITNTHMKGILKDYSQLI